MATKEGDILLVTKDQVYTKQECLSGATTEMLGECASPDIALFKLAVRSNPNLLDNWYFGNPVNQKAQSEYTTAGYTIDRWYFTGPGKVTVADGHISWGLASGDTGDARLLQKFSDEVNTFIKGKTVTFSALSAEGELVSASCVIPASGQVDTQNPAFKNGSYIDVRDDLNGTHGFRIIVTTSSGTLNLLAVKLEIGPVQTLAHKENGAWVLNEIPNYTEQLLRCQRYYWRIGSKESTGTSYYLNTLLAIYDGGTIKIFALLVNPKVPMRTRPALKINGASPGEAVTIRDGDAGGNLDGTLRANQNNHFITSDAATEIVITTDSADTKINVGHVYEAMIELDANL